MLICKTCFRFAFVLSKDYLDFREILGLPFVSFFSVILVAIEDGFEDELVVAGDGVDAAHFVDASTVIIPQHCCLVQCPTICYEQPQPETYEVVYNSYVSTTGCTIM
ncbi:unnamed protein product [Brassica rapa subsp. trilocularis]